MVSIIDLGINICWQWLLTLIHKIIKQYRWFEVLMENNEYICCMQQNYNITDIDSTFRLYIVTPQAENISNNYL